MHPGTIFTKKKKKLFWVIIHLYACVILRPGQLFLKPHSLLRPNYKQTGVSSVTVTQAPTTMQKEKQLQLINHLSIHGVRLTQLFNMPLSITVFESHHFTVLTVEIAKNLKVNMVNIKTGCQKNKRIKLDYHQGGSAWFGRDSTGRLGTLPCYCVVLCLVVVRFFLSVPPSFSCVSSAATDAEGRKHETRQWTWEWSSHIHRYSYDHCCPTHL